MEFRMLGPLEIADGERLVPLAGRKQRALLAILLVNANRVVMQDRLIEELWNHEPPESATKALQVHVSQLRKTLSVANGPIETRPGGYVLVLDHAKLDVQQFEGLALEGRESLERGDHASAAQRLREALSLWRGSALGEFASEPFAQAEIARLEELRLAALEDRIDADLALGRHAQLVGELEALVAREPLRERLRGQLMLALYRCGRQADALQAYQDARRSLVEELGIEPTRSLHDLEHAILVHDPALDALPRPSRDVGPRKTATVTFLFTDVAGSTRMLRELGDRYADALTEHRRVLRKAFDEYGGREVDTQGDAFFVAFPRAKDAVAAAVSAQRALAETPLRARIGIHTGEPELADEGYVGIDVHRAARICDAGHGGQVLLSQATRDLVAEEFELRDLGEHRLKDLPQRERLFQLVSTDLQEEFPPPRALASARFPAEPTRLVGRERELEQVLALLRHEDVRLLTLTGPGGTGKTRLAVHVAMEALEDFAGGAFLIELAPLTDPGLVIPTVARTLGVPETGRRPLSEALVEYLGDRRVLLVLDNFEHVLAAATNVGALIAAAPHLKVLMTSRSPLHLAAEHEYAVPPLAPDEAVALFTSRAEMVKAEFGLDDESRGAVEEICARLDGLPLAVELAASRMKHLSPQALCGRLGQRLHVLTRGPKDVPQRQQTLRATIDWSYELLNDEEQALFARLAVFAGGCTLEAAEQVCEADLDALASLVDSSLLREDERAGEVRFAMLDTIREYALERLAAGEQDEVRRAHAQHYLALAERAEPELLGADQAAWLARLDPEHDNFRAVLDWALDAGDTELALRMIGSLRRAWVARGYLSETRAWLEAALASSNGAGDAARAKALYGLGRVALTQGDYAHAVQPLEQSVALFRELDDMRGLVYALADLGWIATVRGDHERARTLAEESVSHARLANDETAIAAALHSLACATLEDGDDARASELFTESLALRRSLGDKRNVANSLTYLGLTTLLRGDCPRARTLLEESLSLGLELGNQLVVGAALANLGLVALFEGDPALAATHARRSLALSRELGDQRTIVECLHTLAGVAAAVGEPARAATLSAAAEALHAAIDAPRSPAERAVAERYGLDVASKRGTAMSLDAALDYALGEG
jgi:predicted ATPase/DNA-binding SARP family transcriptional activator